MQYDPSDALERMDNDLGLMAMLISVFLKECPNYIGRLQTACDNKDLNALGDAAHNVKGASAAIGAEECRKLAETLEVTCRQSGVKSIAHLEVSAGNLIDLLKSCEGPLKEWANKNR